LKRIIFSRTGPKFMVWYVAFVAVMNLGLGYFLALYMGGGRPNVAYVADDAFDAEMV